MGHGKRDELGIAESSFRLMNDRWDHLRREVHRYLETSMTDPAGIDSRATS